MSKEKGRKGNPDQHGGKQYGQCPGRHISGMPEIPSRRAEKENEQQRPEQDQGVAGDHFPGHHAEEKECKDTKRIPVIRQETTEKPRLKRNMYNPYRLLLMAPE